MLYALHFFPAHRFVSSRRARDIVSVCLTRLMQSYGVFHCQFGAGTD